VFFEQLRAGGDRNFAYLVGDEATGAALIVDPAGAPDVALRRAEEAGLRPVIVAHTHGHVDHTGGTDEIVRTTGARVLGYGGGEGRESVADGDVIGIGELAVRVLHTPGHTPDSICLLAGDELMTGDTLFVGKVGGTGFGEDARAEFDSLHGKLLVLPEETRVWPGHDYGVRPSSTIGAERRENPFLLCASFEAFVHLKRTWPEYKRRHGIA
jgi:glyoxylase-like metal-dependent hydrolase (beta-lactamase superfamily II)